MQKATKAAESAYTVARYAAAESNDRLRSRESAALEVGIDRTRLARIELGSIVPYPDEVMVMADVYNAPELCYKHCAEDCPIGRKTAVKAESKSIENIAVNAFAALREAGKISETLLTVAADGNVTEDEKAQLWEAADKLKRISCVQAELAILLERNGGD